MKFHYGRHLLSDAVQAQQQSYLLTNGLGGFSAMSLLFSLTRKDQGFFVACPQEIAKRYVLISRLNEVLCVDGKRYSITSQQFVTHTKNCCGEQYLIRYEQDPLPCWTYLVKGVILKKRLVMVHNENTIAVSYTMHSTKKQVFLEVTPALLFCPLEERMPVSFTVQGNAISANDMTMYIHTCGNVRMYHYDAVRYEEDVYFAHDARDGRESVGSYATSLCMHIDFTSQKEASLVFSLETKVGDVPAYFTKEQQRIKALQDKANISSPLGKALVYASDQFIVRKDAQHTTTILAGYPFFLDWGRDTMIAMEGCCIATHRFEEARAIFLSFVAYKKQGILPNVFQGEGFKPRYNTVDASLLFIQALYYYYQESHDLAFIQEKMLPHILDILEWYRKGTLYSIKMDQDGLLNAGSGLQQLTWMDIRYDDILPTPRHGKAVEINAYWYNAISIYCYFKDLLQEEEVFYTTLLPRIRASFQATFWNREKQYLNDVVSMDGVDDRIRCNQIWAVSIPFSPCTNKMAKAVLQCVFEELYTPYGLRTLAMQHPEFKKEYIGSLFQRDMAYHQGSSWVFVMGSYLRGYRKIYGQKATAWVKEVLSYFEDAVWEGCVGQLPELYDGLDPHTSRGCFAQAWSVGEILKICKEIEE